MAGSYYSVITGTGRYIPTRIVQNDEFLNNEFFDISGERLTKSNEEIIEKFRQITDIEERRYVEDEFVTSDIAFFAAREAIAASQIDQETLDYIIVAHNFGDVLNSNRKSNMVPSLAARVKYMLGIKNPYTVAYDLPFGCPGWLQALIQSDYFIRSGDSKKALVIGAETLSRVSDPHDIDSMIYSDGAGAVVVEALESRVPLGIIAHKTRSDTLQHAHLLRMDVSSNPARDNGSLYLKMDGRKVYEYALSIVPQAIKDCIDKAGLGIGDIKQVLIHQANAKMDDAIISRLYKLYGLRDVPEYMMPMTISKLGNNSVATLPILLDLLVKGEIKHHGLQKGDHFVLASVGAGMNVNAMVYRMP